jgi:hypothetical protein
MEKEKEKQKLVQGRLEEKGAQEAGQQEHQHASSYYFYVPVHLYCSRA